MPVFKCMIKIVRRNIGMLAMYMGIFLVLILLFTFSDGQTDDFAETALDLTVIDRDDSPVSAGIRDYLAGRHTLVDLEDDVETLQDELFYRNIAYILYIPDGYGDALAAGDTGARLETVKIPGSVTGVYADNQIEQYVKTLSAYLAADYDLEAAIDYTAADLAIGAQVSVNHETAGASTSLEYFQYLCYLLIAIIISALGPILIAFNRKAVRQRTDASAMPLTRKNAQIALGCAIVAVAIWLFFMLLAVVLYGSELFTAAGGLRILNSFVLLLLCTGLAILIGQFAGNTRLLSGITNVVGLGMSFLCGVFVPQALLGDGIVAASKFLPAYWYIHLNNTLEGVEQLTRGHLETAIQCIGIQLLFTAAIFAACLLSSRLQKNRL